MLLLRFMFWLLHQSLLVTLPLPYSLARVEGVLIRVAKEVDNKVDDSKGEGEVVTVITMTR